MFVILEIAETCRTDPARGVAVEPVFLIAGAMACTPIVRTPCLLQSASMTLRLTMSMIR